MSETGNQISLGGSDVTEQPTSPDDEESKVENETLPGLETESESSSDQPPAESSSTQEQDGGDGSEPEGQDEDEESLSEYGVEDDHRPNNAKLDNPDGDLEQDRRVNKETDNDVGEQEQLFPDVEDDQMTLGGERARNQCLF